MTRPRDRRPGWGSSRGVALLGASMLMIMPAICAGQPWPQDEQDPFDIIYTASLDSVRPVDRSMTKLPPATYGSRDAMRRALPRRALSTTAHSGRQPRFDPVLQLRIDLGFGMAVDTVLVTLEDRIGVPRLPNPSPFTSNRNLEDHHIDRVRALDRLMTRRLEGYAALRPRLFAGLHVRIVRTAWIIPAMTVVMRLDEAAELSRREGVTSVYRLALPATTGSLQVGKPPRVREGRELIKSDHYAAMNLPRGTIALLDMGVRRDHVVFDQAHNPIVFTGNCVGDMLCITPQGLLGRNHGTASAAILVANNRDSVDYVGVTPSQLESFCVYLQDPNSTDEHQQQLMPEAAVYAFQAAIRNGDAVIVAETQQSDSEAFAIGVAAENAFRMGCVVIAANGNEGGAEDGAKVGYPARCRLVLGVGGVAVRGEEPAAQGWGLADNSRMKPDLSAPTGCVTAYAKNPDSFGMHSETSGATPFAAGAAALLRDWMVWAAGGGIDPGQVYAQLILSCPLVGPFDTASRIGAGRIELPAGGWSKFGKIALGPEREPREIPIEVESAELDRVEAAIWWPGEQVGTDSLLYETHSNLDLELIDPTGLIRGESRSVKGLFERLAVHGPIVPGTWKLRISGTPGQFAETVYWTTALRL